MMPRGAESRTSIRKSVLFWWILFVVIQMAERVFLLRDALEQETPTAALLLKTLLVGVRGDFITATFALVLAGSGAGVYTLIRHGLSGLRQSPWHVLLSFRPAFHVGCALAGVLLFVLLCVDMGYYGFNHQHMDFVFLEYIGDLLAPAATTEGTAAAGRDRRRRRRGARRRSRRPSRPWCSRASRRGRCRCGRPRRSTAAVRRHSSNC